MDGIREIFNESKNLKTPDMSGIAGLFASPECHVTNFTEDSSCAIKKVESTTFGEELGTGRLLRSNRRRKNAATSPAKDQVVVPDTKGLKILAPNLQKIPRMDGIQGRIDESKNIKTPDISLPAELKASPECPSANFMEDSFRAKTSVESISAGNEMGTRRVLRTARGR